MENFEIEPGHFISLPGFAYQAFLKQTGVQMDYVTDPDIFDMLSSNLRGGHSFASQRYEESTLFKKSSHRINPGSQNVWKNGTEDDLQYLIDIDMNNLYGCAQSFKIPKEELVFLSNDEKEKIDWINLDPNDKYGFFCGSRLRISKRNL